MKFRLYHYWRSSSSWRVRWALAFKEIPCEFVPINLLSDETESPAHLARNPMGYVPVLEFLEQKTPYPFLCESVAILEWLEEVYPQPSLLPGDPFQKAKIRQLAETINSGTQPLQNLNAVQLHSSDPEEQKKWHQTWIKKGLHAYETLAQQTAGKFSVGDTLTMADLFLIPQCYNAKRQEVSLESFPTIQRIHENALKMESCRVSAPEAFQP
jgi:maleylacetoacetate isomerase